MNVSRSLQTRSKQSVLRVLSCSVGASVRLVNMLWRHYAERIYGATRSYRVSHVNVTLWDGVIICSDCHESF